MYPVYCYIGVNLIYAKCKSNVRTMNGINELVIES